MDGTDGTQVGVTLFGDQTEDLLGGSGITVLGNGNFVIASSGDDNGTVIDPGSARLIDGSTGLQIGPTLFGGKEIENLGSSDGVIALDNNNYVVVSSNADNGAIPDAGAVRLMDGSTGTQIGTTVFGDEPFDFVGQQSAIPLTNSNYVIVSSFDDDSGVRNTGSLILVNGTTGDQIGTTVYGGQEDDLLGVQGVTELSNGNYVVASPDTDGLLQNVGLVQLFSGATGAEVAATTGDQLLDQVGFPGVTALANGNYVVASTFDDDIAPDAGTVRLLDGTDGMQIGASLAGDLQDDFFGTGVFALTDGNFVIVSESDDDGMRQDVGSIVHADGDTAAQIGTTVFGSAANDLFDFQVLQPADGGYFILAAPKWDSNSQTDSGSVQLFAL